MSNPKIKGAKIMHMDNRLFNVNGHGSEGLAKALDLAFMQHGNKATCTHWVESITHGLILLWGKESNDSIALPARLSAANSLTMVEMWLTGDFAKKVKFSKWCDLTDHDGSDTRGWQVYVEDWGHVAEQRYAICAIKPAWCWHGK